MSEDFANFQQVVDMLVKAVGAVLEPLDFVIQGNVPEQVYQLYARLGQVRQVGGLVLRRHYQLIYQVLCGTQHTIDARVHVEGRVRVLFHVDRGPQQLIQLELGAVA